MTLLDLLGAGYVRVSSSKGGIYRGPCPWCGGVDRFHVFPAQGDAGTLWCRQCGKTGDAITYLRERRGMTFRDACQQLGLTHKLTERPPSPRTRGARIEQRAWEQLADAYEHVLWEWRILLCQRAQLVAAEERRDGSSPFTLDDWRAFFAHEEALIAQLDDLEHTWQLLTHGNP